MITSLLDRLLGRLITVDGTRWKYTVTKSSVLARSERGDRRCDTAATVKGVDPHTFERGQWKRTSDGSILPSDVARWLRGES